MHWYHIKWMFQDHLVIQRFGYPKIDKIMTSWHWQSRYTDNPGFYILGYPDNAYQNLDIPWKVAKTFILHTAPKTVEIIPLHFKVCLLKMLTSRYCLPKLIKIMTSCHSRSKLGYPKLVTGKTLWHSVSRFIQACQNMI